jgi:hypothetical protein
MARHSAVGFEAAAVTALAVIASANPSRRRRQRIATVRFGHPFAAVAVAGDDPGTHQRAGSPQHLAWPSHLLRLDHPAHQRRRPAEMTDPSAGRRLPLISSLVRIRVAVGEVESARRVLLPARGAHRRRASLASTDRGATCRCPAGAGGAGCPVRCPESSGSRCAFPLRSAGTRRWRCSFGPGRVRRCSSA